MNTCLRRLGRPGIIGLCVLLWLGNWPTHAQGDRVTGETAALRVGVAASLKPLIFKEKKEFRGIEADLARQLAAQLGRRLEFVELPWDKLIEKLEAGKIDIIMSGMTVTAARQTRVAFTQPYLRTGQTALVRRDQAARMQVFFRDPVNRFGAQRNTTGAYYLEQTFPKSKRLLFSNPEAGAAAVLGGKIDAFISDASVNAYQAAVNESRGLVALNLALTQESLAWAIRKDDTTLRQAADEFVQKAIASGELKAVVDRWLPRFYSD